MSSFVSWKYLGLVNRAGFYILFSNIWLKKYGDHPERYPFKKRYSRVHKFLGKCVKAFKCDYIITGEENIPKDSNVVFTPNHQSNTDPISIVALSDKPLVFLAKKEINKFPFVKNVVRAVSGIFIDRSNLRQEIKIMRKLSEDLKTSEHSYVIFPEGTRSRPIDHPLLDFKPGALKPAYIAKKPIVPVAIHGAYRVLDKHLRMKKFPIQIAYLKPHYPEEFEKVNTIDMAKKIQSEINEKLKELKKNDVELVKKYRYKHCKWPTEITGI
ncbi:MAG: lysophospholipid acyltransferase family protein [Bacilli bacterium]